MMKRGLQYLLLAACSLAAVTADGVELAPQAVALVQMPSSSGKPAFAQPIILRGTLGSAEVQANLRAQTDGDDGFEGEYLVAGQPQKILLAGELDGDDVFMEESENGKDVSGQWSGRLAGNLFSGTWQSADGLVIKPFSMTIVRAGQ